MSDLAAYVGAKYEGDMVDGKMHGRGRFTFADGSVFEGTFADGHFHGEGKLLYPHGGVFTCTWEHGVVVSGTEAYVCADGLPFAGKPQEDGTATPLGPRSDMADWQYLTPDDRRFASEIQAGIRPGDGVARANES